MLTRALRHQARLAVITIPTLALLISAAIVPAAQADNEITMMPLHVEALETFCPDFQDPCPDYQSRVDAMPGESIAVFVMTRHYDNLIAMQAAYVWDASWTFLGTSFDCQAGQLNARVPSASGATDGTVSTAFRCIDGGSTAPIGILWFVAGQGGCLEIVESTFPFGTHVVDQDIVATPVYAGNYGRICVGAGGYDACEPTVGAMPGTSVRLPEDSTWGQLLHAAAADCVVPVEHSTWGEVKAHYR